MNTSTAVGHFHPLNCQSFPIANTATTRSQSVELSLSGLSMTSYSASDVELSPVIRLVIFTFCGLVGSSARLASVVSKTPSCKNDFTLKSVTMALVAVGTMMIGSLVSLPADPPCLEPPLERRSALPPLLGSPDELRFVPDRPSLALLALLAASFDLSCKSLWYLSANVKSLPGETSTELRSFIRISTTARFFSDGARELLVLAVSGADAAVAAAAPPPPPPAPAASVRARFAAGASPDAAVGYLPAGMPPHVSAAPCRKSRSPCRSFDAAKWHHAPRCAVRW